MGAITDWTTWKRGGEALLSLVYPNRCQICSDEPSFAAEGYVGPHCRQSLRRVEAPCCSRCGLPFQGAITQEFICANCDGMDLAFDHARAAVVASGVALEVIHRYKYQRALWFEPFLTDLLVTAAAPTLAGDGWTTVVPVPLHPVKHRQREFNQAEHLARPLAAALGLPLDRTLVRRDAATLTQTHLSRSQRAKNVHHAFQATDERRIDGASVIIVDDVLTTGATTSALAALLRRRGASRVCVWSVARAVLHEPPVA